MMTRVTAEMKRIFEQMNDKQKIRMFYELGKYIISNVDENVEDKDMYCYRSRTRDRRVI